MPARANRADFEVDTDIYPLESVFGASYIFLDRCFVHLSKPSSRKIRVTLTPKPDIKTAISELEGEFNNELLNQALRGTVHARNLKLREYIVGRALFGAEQQSSTEQLSYSEDPLGIAIPWEQKYGRD